MKVYELIQMLESFNPNADVHIQYNYGDYWRTQVAPKASSVEECPVTYSDYHQMDKVVEEPGDDERMVVVIG